MIKVLGAYDDLFKYYDNVNMITVENFVEEASDFQGSGLNATERTKELFDDTERNPPGVKDKPACTHFIREKKNTKQWQECRKVKPDDTKDNPQPKDKKLTGDPWNYDNTQVQLKGDKGVTAFLKENIDVDSTPVNTVVLAYRCNSKGDEMNGYAEKGPIQSYNSGKTKVVIKFDGDSENSNEISKTKVFNFK